MEMKNSVQVFKHLSLITELSMLMLGNIAAGAGIGYLLDKKFDIFPALFITFMLIGIVSGFRGVYKTIMRTLK